MKMSTTCPLEAVFTVIRKNRVVNQSKQIVEKRNKGGYTAFFMHTRRANRSAGGRAGVASSPLASIKSFVTGQFSEAYKRMNSTQRVHFIFSKPFRAFCMFRDNYRERSANALQSVLEGLRGV